ncbi:MAG: MOSC N-terminal beta barrel domain-containing protein [Acidobacteriaceae bacterium]|nr:MOSC N-terminal beta barrel domain-containing protein [Acidobacteriaceae bacterium]
MYIQEIWRYPVKSMAGERLRKAMIGVGGIEGDRRVVVARGGRLVTARKDYKLLGLKGTLDPEQDPLTDGQAWNSPEALALVKGAAGPDAEIFRPDGRGFFDVLPLLVATDGAIQHMRFDGRRLRPNIIVGGVNGLAERQWPNHYLHIGDVVIHAAQLRGRCVMTTYDPDSLKQDANILRKIVKELGGTMALDCSVVRGGEIEEGAQVWLEERR